jgi:hypothetical protein
MYIKCHDKTKVYYDPEMENKILNIDEFIKAIYDCVEKENGYFGRKKITLEKIEKLITGLIERNQPVTLKINRTKARGLIPFELQVRWESGNLIFTFSLDKYFTYKYVVQEETALEEIELIELTDEQKQILDEVF